MQASREQLAEWTANNSSFSKEMPGLQLAWDSTSLGLLKECPHKYALTMLCGHGAMNDHLFFGILYHECQEEYKKTLIATGDHDEAVAHATLHALSASGTHKAVADSNGESEMVEWYPWESDIPEKNRFTLVRTVIWWADQYRKEDTDGTFKTKILANGEPAIEMPFAFDSGIRNTITGEGNYIFCGRLDEGIEHMNFTMIRDAKTTKYSLDGSYYERYSPDNQMSMYSLAGKVVLGEPIDSILIDAAQITKSFSRFGRGFVERTPGQLDEWLRDQEYWIRLNEQFVRDGYWPMNDTSCSKYGGCPFAKRRMGAVCTKDPAVRQSFLDTHFPRRVWDPMSRGESNANT